MAPMARTSSGSVPSLGRSSSRARTSGSRAQAGLRRTHRGDLTKVVHASQVERQLVPAHAQQLRDHLHQRDGRLSADDLDRRETAYGRLDDAAGIGQIENNSVRRSLLNQAADGEDNRDAAQRAAETAGADRLFAGDAKLAGSLVKGAAFQPANANLVQDVVSAFQCLLQAGRYI